MAISLIGLVACTDPVTDAVVATEVLGHKLADVSGSLPAGRAEVLDRLARYGYKIDNPDRCLGTKTPDRWDIWAPNIEKAIGTHERLYFFKRINKAGSGESFGLAVDFDFQGRVLKAVSFKTGSWFF
ncbi:MAG: hypothetical protein ABMA14_04840 [Hyphomonadaceae bacterium]